MTTNELNIYQRINAVMKDVSYVKKDAEVQGYKAVTHDQVISEVRQSLINNGIVIYPRQVGGGLITPIFKTTGEATNIIRFSCIYDVHFVNIDKPDDRIIVTVESHANDNGDKAPGKALTYATKSALIKVLSLETGINDESRGEVKEKIKKLTQLPDDINDQINACETFKDVSNLWKTVSTKDRADTLREHVNDTLRAFVTDTETIEDLNDSWKDIHYDLREAIKPYFATRKQEMINEGQTDPITGYSKNER